MPLPVMPTGLVPALTEVWPREVVVVLPVTSEALPEVRPVADSTGKPNRTGH